MNRHLSDEEISAWLIGEPIGERTGWQAEHVAACPECRAQTSQLQNALAGFRESAIVWAARRQPAAVIPPATPWWQPRPEWLLAAAALLLITAAPLYRSHSAHQSAAYARAAIEAAEDAALLKQVDTEISKAVPGPMEPLVTLVAWNPDPTNQSNKGSNETNR